MLVMNMLHYPSESGEFSAIACSTKNSATSKRKTDLFFRGDTGD